MLVLFYNAWQMTEIIDSNEELEKEPLKLRIHHIDNLRGMWLVIKGPFRNREIAENSVVSAAWRPIEKLKALAETHRGISEYKEDLMGSTPEEEERYFQRQAQAIWKFAVYPDNWPVKLLIGEEDGFCNSCISARHCGTDIEKKGDEKASLEYFGKLIQSGTITTLGEIRQILDKIWQPLFDLAR